MGLVDGVNAHPFLRLGEDGGGGGEWFWRVTQAYDTRVIVFFHSLILLLNYAALSFYELFGLINPQSSFSSVFRFL